MKKAAPSGGAARDVKQKEIRQLQYNISLAPPPPFRAIGEAVGTVLLRLSDQMEAKDVP